jgi:hypothetical protein
MPWLPGTVLQSGGTLDFTLSASPDPAWGSSPASGPPSFGPANLPALGYSSPGGALSVTAGQPAAVQLGVVPAAPRATSVVWKIASVPPGLQVSPSSGTLALQAPGGDTAACRPAPPATQELTITGAAAGSDTLRVDLLTTTGTALPPVVLDVTVQP